MMSHVDSRCKNLLDDNDYHTVMTQIKMVNENSHLGTIEIPIKHRIEFQNTLGNKHVFEFVRDIYGGYWVDWCVFLS